MTARAGVARAALLALALAGAACAPARQVVDPARDLPPALVPPPLDGEPYLRALVLGDWGTGKDDQRRVAVAMATFARDEGCDLVVSTGDNFYPSGVESADDAKWETHFRRVYDHPALQVPWLVSLGNHDHEGDAAAQVEYGRRDPRWLLPAPWYTQVRTLADGTEVQLWALDTTPISRGLPGWEAQVAWLDETLARSGARWKVVFGHHPLHGHGPRGDDAAMIARVGPVLARHEVDLYLAGHDHVLEVLRPIDGVLHVTSGAGAGPGKATQVGVDPARQLYGATLGGFAWLRFARDELVVACVRLDGRAQFVHVVPK